MKLPETNLRLIAELDAAIHNPARLMIVYLLARHPALDYLNLMQQTCLTSGNITTHLNRLADSGYISIRKTFRGKKPHTVVKLTDAGKTAYRRWGEMVLAALPDSVKQDLVSLHKQQALYRTLQFFNSSDLKYGIPDWRSLYNMPDFYLRGLVKPLPEESCLW